MNKLENLEPSRVFHYFEEISKIPHGSQNTKAISDYLREFGESHNLETYQDEKNNIILIKAATAGYENRDTIILQGHMDMVCEKEKNCTIDFEKDPLDLYVDGDYLKARGTTLGGDDGIAVAYALAILEDDSIKHPRLEVIITVDEEIGMLGAFDMDLSKITGRKMLNIDSDVEGVFLTGCAGGMSLISHLPVLRTQQEGTEVRLTVTGLKGGHSGAEIDKERANANILMGRLLSAISTEMVYGIESMEGGLKDNAIPRESEALILISEETAGLQRIVKEQEEIFKKELAFTDPEVKIEFEILPAKKANVINPASVMKLIFFLRQTPNGMINMSKAMEGIVETSLNLGILSLKEDELYTVTSIRSSVTSRKEELKDRVTMLVEMLGGETEVFGDYPAWEYKADSSLRPQIAETYEKLFGKQPEFTAIHAGLECGIFSDKLEGLDCVSFGPENLDIHTPDERLSISSTKRMWDFIIDFLAR